MPLLLLVYVIGVFFVGIPISAWSIRAWRNRHGKKFPLVFLFPLHYHSLGDKMLRHGAGTYECGDALIHSMVSESHIMDSQWTEHTDARLACARYIFASALTWPFRIPYLLLMLIALAIHEAWAAFFPGLITQGGKLLLLFPRWIRF